MSNRWFTIFGPQDWDGVNINTGNKKIDGKYFNILGDKNVQLSASGTMWLVGASGIQLITEGYVDTSGLRAKTLYFEKTQRIDSTGSFLPTYSGPSGALLYKVGDNDVSGVPVLTYNTGLASLTMPNMNYGHLYVSSGNDGARQVLSNSSLQYSEPVVINNVEAVPAKLVTSCAAEFTKNITIGPNFEAYKGSILTHMGSGVPAEWQAAQYLKADGVLWNRYPKRPVKIEDGQIIFYKDKPSWAQDWFDGPSIDTIIQEFGIGDDTIAIIRNDTREITYVKLVEEIRYGNSNDTEEDLVALAEAMPLYSEVEKIDDPDNPDSNIPGILVKFCSRKPWEDRKEHIGNGYAFSVTKGGYLDMQLGRSATNTYGCSIDPQDVSSSPFRFKPSTMNSISIRPDTHTAFNMLAENIDFVVYGKYETDYGNYQESVFGLDSGNLPAGLVAAFKVDANVPDALSGLPSSGVFKTKFLDRAKLFPSGIMSDKKPKILINTNQPYIVDTIPTGTGTNNGVVATGYGKTYADLTVNSILYSENIISQDIYLRPKPEDNNDGKYIANALLTLDKSGKIISRIPKTQATVADRPINIGLDPTHQNGLGNAEISIRWTPPEKDGGSEIINYFIQFSTNSGSSWTDLPNNLYTAHKPTNSSNYATIKGLLPNTIYLFRVAAQNAIGIGPYSTASDPIILSDILVPRAPVNFYQRREFDFSNISDIFLSWENGQGGTTDILGYTIEESSDKGQTWYYYNNPNNLIDSTSEVISGTTSNLDYYYRISAWNNAGQSAFAYVFSSGNFVPDPVLEEDNKTVDLLSNWDFGSILFTGVCPT